MVYGQNMSQAIVNFNADNVVRKTYYYQEKTNDGSYSDSNFVYDYEQDKPCDLTPGLYQIYAVIETDNYLDIKTPLRDFSVSTTTKNNYALFTHESNTTEYTRLTGSDEVAITYAFEKANYSDYLSSLYDVYICEVDNSGNVALSDDGNPIFACSLAGLSGSDYYSVTNDAEITTAGLKTLNLSFSSNRILYKPMTLR